MADTQGPSSTTLLDQLANLDPQERRDNCHARQRNRSRPGAAT